MYQLTASVTISMLQTTTPLINRFDCVPSGPTTNDLITPHPYPDPPLYCFQSRVVTNPSSSVQKNSKQWGDEVLESKHMPRAGCLESTKHPPRRCWPCRRYKPETAALSRTLTCRVLSEIAPYVLTLLSRL